MRHRPPITGKKLCALTAILAAASLSCYHVLRLLGAPFFGRADDRSDDDGAGAGGPVAAANRRDDDSTLLFPSPYVAAKPPHPPRDPSWDQLVTVASPPEEGARAVAQRSTREVHAAGLWHRAAYVVVMVGDAMLMQQRSDNKWTYPGLWDYSAAETMEGDESFAEAASSGVGEEMRDLLKEGASFPALRKCCGPFTYVWEGAMPYMYIKEKTVVEAYHARIDDDHLNEESLRKISNQIRIEQGETSTSLEEVGGWMLMPIKRLREEAKSLGSKKYAPWLLVALDQCRACWDDA